MTTAERKALIKRVKELNSRIRHLSASNVVREVVQDIIEEYSKEADRLTKVTYRRREYLYNFIGGGWNSEWAFTVEEAIQQAKDRWANGGGPEADEESFRVSDPADYRNLLSLFY